MNLNAGQTEATVGMVTSPEPISLDVFGVFGLPVTLCRSCPQYGHAIIFSRKCYYQAQYFIPLLIHKMKARARKTGVTKIDPKRTDAIKQWKTPAGSEESVPSAGRKILPVLDSHHSPKEYSDTLVGVHPTSLLIGPSSFGRAETTGNKSSSQTTQNFPKVSVSPQTLDPHVSPRRPALNFFQRFLAWAWRIRLQQLETKEMTNFGWRKRT